MICFYYVDFFRWFAKLVVIKLNRFHHPGGQSNKGAHELAGCRSDFFIPQKFIVGEYYSFITWSTFGIRGISIRNNNVPCYHI